MLNKFVNTHLRGIIKISSNTGSTAGGRYDENGATSDNTVLIFITTAI